MDRKDVMRKWAYLKYFSEHEAWGNPDAMSSDLLLMLDEFRSKLGERIVVTAGTQGMHSINSQHHLGKAVDIVMPDRRNHFLDVFFLAERLRFKGIGVYFHWNYHGQKVVGFHLDDRVKEFARWIGVPSGDGTIQYMAFNHENLKKYGEL